MPQIIPILPGHWSEVNHESLGLMLLDAPPTLQRLIARRQRISLPRRCSDQERLARLRAAWVRAPRPERWLRDLGVAERGIDWPLLRRRLLAWAAALPSGRLLDPAALHPALADALGPLSDAQTHGFRCCPPDRAPWQSKVADPGRHHS